MLNNVGPLGIILIAVVILIVFGRGKISSMMGEVGRGITSFKKGINEGKNELKNSDDLVSVKDTDNEDLVVSLMEKYDLVALPVVDEKGILVGRITIDDAVDVIIEEAEKDYQLAS